MKKSELKKIIQEVIEQQAGNNSGKFTKTIPLNISDEDAKELEQMIGNQSGVFEGDLSERPKEKKKCKWSIKWCCPPEIIIDCP
jgi:hypothetical protein